MMTKHVVIRTDAVRPLVCSYEAFCYSRLVCIEDRQPYIFLALPGVQMHYSRCNDRSSLRIQPPASFR